MTIIKSLQYIEPEWSVPSCVKAVTTTRIGGLSQSPYDGLNLGEHVGDEPAAVASNRQFLATDLALPSPPVWLSQTHSTNVVLLSEARDTPVNNTDGAVAFSQGVVCAVMTADCLPLFLANRSGTKVGVVHVGWRGLADGVIEQGIASMDEQPERIVAWAGPCISQLNFEIGEQVKLAIGGSDSAYVKGEKAGKWYANLALLAGERLAKVGVSDYHSSDLCTYRDGAQFYSHRRDQITGRMASLIWMA